jgi:hypothetical protein
MKGVEETSSAGGSTRTPFSSTDSWVVGSSRSETWKVILRLNGPVSRRGIEKATNRLNRGYEE